MRITGGIHRSRTLRAPRGDHTRPTSDRVREALFAILGARRSLEGARVLDLYAGTGALGLEALSRGAAYATLVESARSALDAIAANVDALGLRGQVRVVASPVERATQAIRAHAPFDLVLADPPYARVADGEAGRTLDVLAEAGLFAPEVIVVLEHSSGDQPPALGGLVLQASRRYGDTTLSLYVFPACADAREAD